MNTAFVDKKLDDLRMWVISLPPELRPAFLLGLGALLITLAPLMTQAYSVKQESSSSDVHDSDTQEDVWLTKHQAAELLNVHPHWFSGKKLPFAKKIGHRTVRYSKLGLLRWRTTRKMA